MSKTFGRGGWGPNSTRFFPSNEVWDKVRKIDAEAKQADVRQRIFCASMADVFEDRQDLDAKRLDVWQLIESTSNLDWQLLTKRPENISHMVPAGWLSNWPERVWIGCTVEDQVCAEKRLPHLLRIPASIRFVSCEPLLGPLNLMPWLADIHWVIAGGESGARHRPSDAGWFRSLRDQCVSAKVPFLFKQWGGRWNSANGRELDGREWNEFPSEKAK